MTSVTIGNSVERILASAFLGSGLTEVIIPNSVDTIGERAF
ncbi:MAG: leucine-rich repeat domain-containing protein, partial [Prevotellaceae bacterium]|nr:leucine-rich repeat domain-containing protein [Prevotellaceae bacterium]